MQQYFTAVSLAPLWNDMFSLSLYFIYGIIILYATRYILQKFTCHRNNTSFFKIKKITTSRFALP